MPADAAPGTTDILQRAKVMQIAAAEQDAAEGIRVVDVGIVPELIVEIERLRAVIRVNALRWNPALTHAEIDEVIRG